MTAILGATTRRVILALTPTLIVCTALDLPDTAQVTDRALSAQHRQNQDWV
ncbi:hypothetical protein [Streptomyces sp. NPDC058773]|uniref:hypothetical protein n=1 Tax=Streptomyces sp. NPDC058773 TaxID=3346632 RepID=UPI0036AFED44